jgi:hypothetical protein
VKPVTDKKDVAHVGHKGPRYHDNHRDDYNQGGHRHRSVHHSSSNQASNNVEDVAGGIDPAEL